MTQFSIGTSVYEQIRGSPMGSPLSPALCMMVVALSGEIWYKTYRTTLSNMDLTARLLRYVDNRLCLSDPSWDYEICFANFLTRSSTAILSFWKLNRTRSSWAFASSSSLLPSATALHATSTRSWRHSPHHLWPSNFQALFHDYFWSPNVRTPHMNGHEVLPHCIICTDQPVSPESDLFAAAKPIRQYLHVSYCGKILNCLAADAYVHCSHLAESLTPLDLICIYFDHGTVLFQQAYPQTRLHLPVGPYSTHCHGFLVSYDVNSDPRTSVSSISS